MQNLTTVEPSAIEPMDLATFRNLGFKDLEPESIERLSTAISRMPGYAKLATPWPDAWVFWQSLLEDFGLNDLSIGDLSIWSDVLQEDEAAFRFTLSENWPTD